VLTYDILFPGISVLEGSIELQFFSRGLCPAHRLKKMAGTVSQIDIDKSVRWYAEFLDGIPLAIYRTTLEGKLVFCNKAFAQLFGFAAVRELIGYPVVQLYRNHKDRGILVETIIRGGRVEDFPLSLMKRDGTPLWCAVTAEVVFDEDGMAVLLDGVIRDITEEIKEKEALGHFDVTGTSSKEKFLGVMEMAGGVAHKLNQPLTVISNLLNEVISDLSPHDKNYENIVKIDNQIKKLNEIARKIGAIRKYEAMEYVAGVKIVDIDKASRVRKGEEIP